MDDVDRKPEDAPRKQTYERPVLVSRDKLPAITADTIPVSGITDAAPSDIRLKEDIQQVGTTVHGLALYRFRYRGQPEIYEGVMAHEARRVMPDAVRRGEDGYLRVDYTRLGAPFRRVH